LKKVGRTEAQQSKKLDESANLMRSLSDRIEVLQANSKNTLQILKREVGVDDAIPNSSLHIAEDIEFLTTRISRLRLSSVQLKTQQEFLKSLSFENRLARHSAIPEAHKKTFRWAFQHDPDSPRGNLLKWFQHGDSIFWVSGKPGSGKSTFMKFVAGDKQSKTALETWALPKRLVVASHYFWCSGSSGQRSQQRLLQTLLFEIFRQCPDLIEVVCAERWADFPSNPSRPWTFPELRRVCKAFPRGKFSMSNFVSSLTGWMSLRGIT
jgi:hypothetical protein